jgi:hypothetical protein
MTGIRVFNSIMLRRATLEGCVAMATVIGSSRFPWGGVLLSLLWCLVVDELIVMLSGCGIYFQDYADDICLLVVGKFPNIVSGLMQ